MLQTIEREIICREDTNKVSDCLYICDRNKQRRHVVNKDEISRSRPLQDEKGEIKSKKPLADEKSDSC